MRSALRAKSIIRRYLKPTNLTHYSELSRLMDAEIFVKHENHNPTSSFKIRGAINLFGSIDPEDATSGVLVATRGNHGLAMAWAAQWFNLPCTVVVPESNSEEINHCIEGFGAELIIHGHDFYDAQLFCDELSESAGYYYVEQGNEVSILNGIGTMTLEIMEDLPDVDVIISPIGGGALCASIIKVARGINPEIEIIGVQAETAASFYHSWQKGKWVVLDNADTIADGLAARSVFQLPYVIMKDQINDVVLLREDEILSGVNMSIESTHNLAECAGAASLVAAMKIKDRLKGKRVALIMSGGNIERKHLVQAIQ
ncbi:MAG: threonine/serine dehydratase [Thermodesulfobacteriota bacterium]|nr:threonine/serine dehydratase [Thermodesulfobacteriota bacterium]